MTGVYRGHDRVRQVNWLRELSGELVSLWTGDGPITAEDILDYALTNDEGHEGMEMPDWFDATDRKLLEQLVAKRLA